MKKFLLYFLLCVPLTFLCSCQLYSYNQKKPNNFYYTYCLRDELLQNSNVTVSLFDTNLHKEVDITSIGLPTINDFIENLKQENFIEIPNDIPETPQYKLFINFSDTNSKYVINVFNKDLISIHNWDDVYIEDYMNSTNIYKSNNLFNLCKYILNQ